MYFKVYVCFGQAKVRKGTAVGVNILEPKVWEQIRQQFLSGVIPKRKRIRQHQE